MKNYLLWSYPNDTSAVRVRAATHEEAASKISTRFVRRRGDCVDLCVLEEGRPMSEVREVIGVVELVVTDCTFGMTANTVLEHQGLEPPPVVDE